jgi:hypothetical protein
MIMNESAANAGEFLDTNVSVEDFHGLCEKIEEPCRKIDEIRKNYIDPWNEETNFNIFKTISPEHYDWEKLHSEILGAILNPKLEIHNKKYLEIFVGLLKTINTNIKTHDFGSDYTVKIERGHIDILIHDKTHAIIIENKINNAHDMPNQLGRYYEFVKDNPELQIKPENIAVVYLPLDPEKEPWDSFKEEKYQALMEKSESWYVKLPAIARDGKNDFVHGFLIPCLEITENCTARVFLKQYIELVKHLGGENMFSSYQEDILKELYRDKKSISIMDHIVAALDNQKYLFAGLLKKTVMEQLKKPEYGFKDDGENELELLKRVNDIFYLYFGRDPDGIFYHFGFYSDGKLEDKTIKALTEILDNVAKKEDYFGETGDSNDPASWLTKPFFIGEYVEAKKAPLDKVVDYLIGKYTELESEVLKWQKRKPQR